MSDRTIYIKDATARKLENSPASDVYEHSEVLKAKKTEKLNKKYQRKMMLMLFCFFIFTAFVTWRYAKIYEQTGRLNALSVEYKDIQNKNIKLQADIENMMDLEVIKTLAENKLGMYKPGKNQYIYIKLPQTDYIRSSSGNTRGSLIDVLKGIIGAGSR